MPLGLIFSYRSDKKAIFVSGFEFLAASLGGSIKIGDEVVTFGGVTMSNLSKEECSLILKSAAFPLTIRLRRRASVLVSNTLIGSPTQSFPDTLVRSIVDGPTFSGTKEVTSSRQPTEIVADNVDDLTQLT